MDPLVGGLVTGGLSLISGLFGGDNGAAAAAAYQNELSIRQTGIANRQKLRARGQAVEMTAEQLLENQDASYRAMSREQAAFNEQMYGFAMGRNSLIRERILAQSAANTVERYGRSAQRIREIDIVGNYGRQNALFAENVSSAQRQFGRNMVDLAKARHAADKQTVANLQGQMDSLLPSMAQTTYQPPNNQALKIGGAVLGAATSGFGSYMSMKSMYPGGSGTGGGSTSTPNFSSSFGNIGFNPIAFSSTSFIG